METRFKPLTFSDAFKLRNKSEIRDMEEQFKKALMSNAQLDNEKQVYCYQIEALKDDLQELEESYTRIQREHKEKARAHDLLTRDHKKLNEEHQQLQEMLTQREKLIEEHGLILISVGEAKVEDEDEEEGDVDQPPINHRTHPLNGNGAEENENDSVNGYSRASSVSNKAIVPGPTLISKDIAHLVECFDGSTLEAKLKSVFDEREEMVRELKRLRLDLEDERQRSEKMERYSVSSDSNTIANADESESKKLAHEYKFQLKKAEQDIIVLQGNVSRLETQVARFRQSTEESEKLEDELKKEKRNILRDLREAQAKVEELETSNSHLQKRIDKLKNTRMAIINS